MGRLTIEREREMDGRGRCSRKNGQIKFYDFINGPCLLARSIPLTLLLLPLSWKQEAGREKEVN